jgi:aerobic-type carbon monoxide dehydrogenase small subunit (CoxS/CutS family)
MISSRAVDAIFPRRVDDSTVPAAVAAKNAQTIQENHSTRTTRRGEDVGHRKVPVPQSDDNGNRQATLSRRSFLRGSALATAGAAMVGAAAAVLEQAQAATGADAGIVGPGAVAITLEVNGTQRTLEVEPRTTLAEALRGPLGLTGTKIACDRGACSACTVWLDGAPVCACMMLAVDVGTRGVTTIEGLAEGGELHRVQAAFIEHDAMQCGFCTPGMVMSCAALLQHTPEPTEQDVRAAISGHVCRCGTYPHVIAATLAAAKARKP